MVWGPGGAAPVAVPVVAPSPKSAGRNECWVDGVAFNKHGKLIALRHTPDPEVPRGTAEKDAPAARRGVVWIDPARRTAIPTGMGTSAGTLACAFDPTGEWLAVVGEGWPEPGQVEPKDEITRWAEVRVYHAATARLVHREQVLGRYTLTWVAFTPGGKRLVAATLGGTVHWWDVERP